MKKSTLKMIISTFEVLLRERDAQLEALVSETRYLVDQRDEIARLKDDVSSLKTAFDAEINYNKERIRRFSEMLEPVVDWSFFDSIRRLDGIKILRTRYEGLSLSEASALWDTHAHKWATSTLAEEARNETG